MNAQQRLEQLGLSKVEAEVYLALLSGGEHAASVVAKQVSMQRTTVYAILKQLVEKGFATSTIKRRGQIFRAERPQHVAGYYEKRLKTFTEGIPFLESLEKTQLKSSGLRFIETVPELKRYYANVLRDYRGRSYVAMGNSNVWQGIDPDFFIEFRKERAQAQIRTRLLLSADSTQTNPTEDSLLREVKFLPPNYKFKSTIDIYDDQILIVSPEQTALAVVIGVSSMVDIFLSTFEMLWELMPAGTSRDSESNSE